MQHSTTSQLKNVRTVVAVIATLLMVRGVSAAEQPPHAAAPPPKAAPARPPAMHGPPTNAAQAARPPSANPFGPRPATANPQGMRPPSGRPMTPAPASFNPNARPSPIRTNDPRQGGQETRVPTARTTSPTFRDPGPAQSREIHTAGGAVIRARADGSPRDISDPKRGVEIHHGLNGSRRVVGIRPDHSSIVAEGGRNGYVQHPYMFHGQEYGRRTYYVNGRSYDRFYRPYAFHGVTLQVYAPVRYYPAGFYGWAYGPWARPAPYAWGWGGNPWYGYYGSYFAPYPVYAGAAFWLTDYLIAASLQSAYAAQDNPPPPPAGAAALTPEVKQMISDELRRQIAQENAVAQVNQQNPQADPAPTGIAPLLSDNQPHVFVAGADLDLVDLTGRECMLTQGDVVQILAAPPADATTANAVVLASKGGTECAQAANVAITLTDLQEMENHMHATVDQGLAELQAKQGQGGLPAAPPGTAAAPVQAAFVTAAPPPDSAASSEIAQQVQVADQTEQSASVGARGLPAAADTGSASDQISLGQSIEEVTANLGAPKRIVNLGAKKILIYPDMKIIFANDRVSDVQ